MEFSQTVRLYIRQAWFLNVLAVLLVASLDTFSDVMGCDRYPRFLETCRDEVHWTLGRWVGQIFLFFVFGHALFLPYAHLLGIQRYLYRAPVFVFWRLWLIVFVAFLKPHIALVCLYTTCWDVIGILVTYDYLFNWELLKQYAKKPNKSIVMDHIAMDDETDKWEYSTLVYQSSVSGKNHLQEAVKVLESYAIQFSPAKVLLLPYETSSIVVCFYDCFSEMKKVLELYCKAKSKEKLSYTMRQSRTGKTVYELKYSWGSTMAFRIRCNTRVSPSSGIIAEKSKTSFMILNGGNATGSVEIDLVAVEEMDYCEDVEEAFERFSDISKTVKFTA